jgi:uncharacterized protein with HEPN domain
MSDRCLGEFLQDILETIIEIESFTAGINFDTFRTNREKVLAVVKLLEILGEAVKRIPDDTRAQYPHISWEKIAGMRDILVHQYWGIDTNVVWATVQAELPPLKTVIAIMLEDL